jgi:hypothetical protein
MARSFQRPDLGLLPLRFERHFAEWQSSSETGRKAADNIGGALNTESHQNVCRER